MFREGSWAVAGISSKLPSCLCYRSALLTKPPWHWVFRVDGYRSVQQLLGLAQISQLETGRILSLNLASSLKQCVIWASQSTHKFPQAPSLGSFNSLSHSPLALLGYHHKQVLFHRAYDRWPHLEFWFWSLLGCVIFCVYYLTSLCLNFFFSKMHIKQFCTSFTECWW